MLINIQIRYKTLFLKSLTLCLSIGLALIAAGCFTVLRHPTDNMDLRAQDENCSRCHFYDEDLTSGEFFGDNHVADYYVGSNYPWINYYDSCWWCPLEWERVDHGPRSSERKRSESGSDQTGRTQILPKWRPVARTAEAESLRLSIAHRFPNPRINAPGSGRWMGSRQGAIGAPVIIGAPGGAAPKTKITKPGNEVEKTGEIRTKTKPGRKVAPETDTEVIPDPQPDKPVKPAKNTVELNDQNRPEDPPPPATKEPESTGKKPPPVEKSDEKQSSTPRPEPKKEPRITPKRK